ncbi:MAG: EamA family transporter [Nocardioidaceae bacterium]|nr:EamA family transporter [Nocardioidaceae bacterium]
MSGTALALVLVAALCHALWNLAARGVTSDGGLFVFLYSLASAALWIPVGVVWLVVAEHPPFAWTWLLVGALSGVLHTAYGVVLQRGYRRGDLSLVYPVARGVGPLLTLVVAVLVLGERPAPVSALGAVIVVAGIAVIAAPDRLGDRTSVMTGLGWGAATGVTIAAYTLWDGHSVDDIAVPPLPYFAISLVFTALPLAPRAWRRRSALPAAWRADRRPVLVVAVLSPLAYLLVLQAMTLAPVALVAAARESSIVLGTVLGVTLLKEPGGWRRGVGALVVLGGIGLVALG